MDLGSVECFVLEFERKPRKLLIVERKLVSNRGHHHTQIAGLKSLLPDFSTYLVVGEDYSGFMGEPAATLAAKGFKLARLNAKLRYGTISQRISARIRLIRAGRISSPPSAYGAILADVCKRNDFGPNDLIVIPTAELDSLESARELSEIMGMDAPHIALRFLGTELGEKNPLIRERRLIASTARLPSNIFLFSETEELSRYFATMFGLNVTGRFFMPCTIGVGEASSAVSAEEGKFRIGVFGAPRFEKGSTRVASIIEEVMKRSQSSPVCPIEFVIQGSRTDFGNGGIYGALQPYFRGNGSIFVSPHHERLSPAEFKALFCSVDAILLPYERSVYALQGSGVIQDAVAALKPIVHTEGISMAGFLSHGNAIAATSDSDFAAAITRMVSDPSPFREGASKANVYFSDLLKSSPLLRL